MSNNFKTVIWFLSFINSQGLVCILTFRNEVSSRTAYKLFNKWKVQLKNTSRQNINYALFIEPTRSRDNIPHLHVLMSGVGDEKTIIWQRNWFLLAGQAKIKPYDPELGAAYYLGDKMALGKIEVMLSHDLRCLAVDKKLFSKKDPVTLLL
jgi:hypothetical protein